MLPQMHLGYHELRNMLAKFKEEREKRKSQPSSTPAVAPPVAGSSPVPGAPPRSGDRDYRSSRDEYRERDRGYERHGSSRYEYVSIHAIKVESHANLTHSERRRDRSRSPGRRRY